MGCGASQTDVIRSVVPKNNADEIKSRGDVMNGSSKPPMANSNGNGSTLSNSSTIPATDYYQEALSGAPANDYLKPLPRNLPPLKPLRGAKSFAGFTDQNTNDLNLANRNNRIEPVAFDVPVEDDLEGVSLIKRHPPRRLRKTMEDQLGEPASLTQEGLDEKVQQANQRRNQVLHERVASARQKSARVVRVRTNRPTVDPEQFMNEFHEANERD